MTHRDGDGGTGEGGSVVRNLDEEQEGGGDAVVKVVLQEVGATILLGDGWAEVTAGSSLVRSAVAECINAQLGSL